MFLENLLLRVADIMEKEDIYKLVGQPFVQFNDKGKAWGCLAPLYQTNEKFNTLFDLQDAENFLENARKYATEIPYSELKAGDWVAILMPFNMWHVMVYIENGKFIHCTRDTGMIVQKMNDTYKKRIKGVFRWL